MTTIKTPRDAERALLSQLIQDNGGEDIIESYVSYLKEIKTFKDPKYYTRTKYCLRSILYNNQKIKIIKKISYE
jgi:hypothetical protein